MKGRIDEERCMGHAMCAALAPDIYEVSDSGTNDMGEFEVAPGAEDAARRGALACPERAILLEEDVPAG
ncbi:ferredoxin [Streptomyces sp. M19]